MELSELRQRWQQAAAAPQPPAGPDLPDEATLRNLLHRGGSKASPVARLERNMWLEIVFTALVAVSSVVGLLLVEQTYWRSWLGLMLLICVLAIPYYARKWQLIGRLRDPHGSVREHVRRQVTGIRALTRLYYQITMWSIPVWLVVALYFTGSDIERHLSGPKVWIGLSMLVGFYLLFGTFLFFLMRRFTRWWLQTLYGQHLDQLEASLAELEEPALR